MSLLPHKILEVSEPSNRVQAMTTTQHFLRRGAFKSLSNLGPKYGKNVLTSKAWLSLCFHLFHFHL